MTSIQLNKYSKLLSTKKTPTIKKPPELSFLFPRLN